ncbi:GLPGLI family protein [Fluviicola chungangensis]|uniref:GLPGLI family protein n=1 Tax=Fluviicola chungangensis TaxID=2597671 RepID=A0A556MIR6_9FLAO|nr:GLPGLI family protein [Fluviicola chungangensis]TSJ39810.1 GLPGLI family protein [Fluviicola chungangensis]
MGTAGIRIFILFGFLFLGGLVQAQGQLVREGKITYERRTNLWKIFDDQRMRDFVGEKNKIKVEEFTLYFNDTASLFSYVAPDQPDPQSFLTMKNTVYNLFPKGQRFVYMDMMGNSMTVGDSLVKHTWKITDKTRKIAGYECTRVIWQKDDTTRIYAWYTTDIIATVGPENIQGLPGAVLGLATEDGSIVYFAKKVEVITPTAEQIAQPKKKGKQYTQAELIADLTEKLKGQPYGERIITGMFYW